MFIMILQGRYYDHPHFIDEKSEAVVKIRCPRSKLAGARILTEIL